MFKLSAIRHSRLYHAILKLRLITFLQGIDLSAKWMAFNAYLILLLLMQIFKQTNQYIIVMYFPLYKRLHIHCYLRTTRM